VGPDPRDAVETFEAAERPVLSAPIGDALRQRWSHARQARDLRHVGTVEIDALSRKEWPGQLRGSTRRLLESRAVRRGRGFETDIAGRGGGRGREEEANARTSEGESSKEESSTAIVHRDNLCHPLRTTVPKKRGNAKISL